MIRLEFTVKELPTGVGMAMQVFKNNETEGEALAAQALLIMLQGMDKLAAESGGGVVGGEGVRDEIQKFVDKARE